MQTIIKLNVMIVVDHEDELDVDEFVSNLDYSFDINEPYVTIRKTEIIELLSTEEV